MFELTTALDMLDRTPRTIHAILHDLPPSMTQCKEGPDTWSPHEVVAHLVYCEQTVWMERLQCMMNATGDRTFAPVDRTAHEGVAKERSTTDLLADFARLRTSTLSWIREQHITNEDLARTAIHPSLGTVTFRELLAVYVRHDLTHTRQILRVLAASYQDAIGPWSQREHYRSASGGSRTMDGQ